MVGVHRIPLDRIGASPFAFAIYRAWSALQGLIEHANVKLPRSRISRAARSRPPIAARASAPPTLTLLTPRPDSEASVCGAPAMPISTLTGLSTELTTAAMSSCSRTRATTATSP